MKRLFFILLGTAGLGLVALSGLILCGIGFAFSNSAVDATVLEVAAVAAGLALAGIGFHLGRGAGEVDPGSIDRAVKARDHNVAGPELLFACPACRKSYRASPMLAGRPFMCRECDITFGVPPIGGRVALPKSAA